jgi:uncharacterized protein (DUF697 family)/CRP-like cAMP-binding protein
MDLSIYFTLDFLMGFVTLANVLGIIGGICTVASMSMKTVIPLRIAAIAGAFFFLCSAIFARSVPSMFLYAMLLPLNSMRLYQMIELIKKVRAAASADLSMDWLQPFMTKRRYKKGAIVFRKGDHADEMFLAAKGKYRIPEINIELRPGHIFGELGLLTSGSQRTASIECVESGHLLTISYDKVRELYFENPEFGFYFLRLIGERLLENQKRAEQTLAAERQRNAAAAGGEPHLAQATSGSGTAAAAGPAQDPRNSDAVEMTEAHRHELASQLVSRFSLWSGAAGLIPVPLVDVAAVGGVQLQMLRRISEIYGVAFSENMGKSIIASLAGSMIPATAATTGTMGIASLAKGVPGVGTVIGAVSMPALSAGSTFIIGKVFIRHFASGGTFLDFNPPDYREFIKSLSEKMSDRMQGTRHGIRGEKARPARRWWWRRGR